MDSNVNIEDDSNKKTDTKDAYICSICTKGIWIKSTGIVVTYIGGIYIGDISIMVTCIGGTYILGICTRNIFVRSIELVIWLKVLVWLRIILAGPRINNCCFILFMSLIFPFKNNTNCCSIFS